MSTARSGARKNLIRTTDSTEDVMALLYRLGGATVEQVGAMLCHLYAGRWEGNGAFVVARRTLTILREQGLAEGIGIRREWMGRTHGRHETFHRLRKAGGGDGVVMGAVAAGEDGEKALQNYRRAWSGGGILHAAMRVDYFLELLDGAYEAGAKIDPDIVRSETYEAYPLIGARLPDLDAAGEPRKRGARGTARARRLYSRVVPDGEFHIKFNLACSDYYLEVERRTNARVVAEKVERYAGRWLRIMGGGNPYAAIREDGLAPINEIRPLVILHHDHRRARRSNPREAAGAPALRDALRDRLYAGTGHFKMLQGVLERQNQYADPGKMVLVAGWDDVRAWGAYASVYHPVGCYAEEDGEWTVDLAATANERVRMVSAI